MEFLAGFSFWLVGLGAMLTVSVWVLGPLDRRARIGPRRMQFTLGDWICLILMIQVWAAAVHSLAAAAELADKSAVFMMDAVGWVFVVALWLGVVRRLSSAGVRNAWHRAAALLFAYPLNVMAAIMVPGLLWVSVVNFIVPPASRIPLPAHMACAIATLLILGAMLATARLVRAIVTAIDFEPIGKNLVEVRAASDSVRQSHEGSNPENGQDDREQK